MPDVLLFWRGAVSYADFWAMPHDDLERLMRYQRDWKPPSG